MTAAFKLIDDEPGADLHRHIVNSRPLEGLSIRARRAAWRETYAESLADVQALDADIDRLEEQRVEMMARHSRESADLNVLIETTLDKRTAAHRNVVRASRELADLEEGSVK